MVKISKSVFIQAPVEKVFEFFSEPANLPEIWPSVVDVRDVQRSGDEVQGWRYTYKMAGMKFDGQTKVIERIENQRFVTDNEGGGLSARIAETYTAEGDGTRLDWDVEYTIPGALLGKLAEPFIRKMNEREAETVLANLKDRMET